MKSYIVTHIAQPLADWLSSVETTAQVTARFAHTIHLNSADVPLWAMTMQPNVGAFRLVLSSLPAWQLGDTVRVRDRRIGTDGDVVEWWGSEVWNPTPRSRMLTQHERTTAVRQIARLLSETSLPESLDWLAPSFTTSPLHDCDTSALHGFVTTLIGRGPGLTPAGDDLLQALLVTLSSGDARDREHFRLLAHITTSQLHHTTPMSQAYLREAMQGYAFGPLRDVLDALPCVVEERCHALLSIGSSSGSAYLLGVLLGLM